MRTVKTQLCPKDEQERLAAVAEAKRAAEMAATIALVSAEWSRRADVAHEDAADAIGAALRARLAAERAEHAATCADATTEARAAWAAAMSAAEADSRVLAAITEGLIAV